MDLSKDEVEEFTWHKWVNVAHLHFAETIPFTTHSICFGVKIKIKKVLKYQYLLDEGKMSYHVLYVLMRILFICRL